MIVIKDRDAETGAIPVVRLLAAVLRHTEITSGALIDLTRFGGLGDRVWQIESKLDAGESVTRSMDMLTELATDSTETIDEMRCGFQALCFGLSDASFLFFQSIDKRLEDKVAEEFREVTFLPDATES